MTVETATKISQLLATAPPGTDPKSEGDNHLRLIKGTLQSVFDDSGTTIKTTLPIESPDGAKFAGAVAITGAVTIDGAVTAKGGLKSYETFALAQAATPANAATFDVSALSAPRIIRVPNADTVTGKWEPIGDARDITGVGICDWINLSAYRRLKITLEGVLSAAAQVVLRVSNNNGTTFLQGASDYQYSQLTQSGTVVAGLNTTATAFLPVTAVASDPNAILFTGEMTYFNKNVISFYRGETMHVSTSLRRDWIYGYLATQSTVARNALRLTLSAGTFTSGIALLEGLRG